MTPKRPIPVKYEPDFATPPGATLRETIERLGIDQRELADRTGLTAKTLNQIIQGKAPLTHQTAMLLERVTKVPARIWNNLEAEYQEQLARLATHEQLAKDIEWLKQIPTKVLIERGLLQATQDNVELLERTLSFFRVATVKAWHEGWSNKQFAFRKVGHASVLDGKIAAWLQMAELEAERAETAPFDKSRFRSAVVEIRKLTTKHPKEFVPQMVSLCKDAGVALCLIPEIPGGKITGAAKWLSSQKAMIAMNLRGKKSDVFWFTFFHEAGHILLDSKKSAYVDVSYSNDLREKNANEFSQYILIPPEHDNRLKTLRTKRAVLEFASEIDVDPGVVVGRLHHEKYIPFTHLSQLKSTFAWE